MSNMQAFHEWLSKKQETSEPYQQLLVRLMAASPAQIRDIKNEFGWYVWNNETSAAEAHPA
jgi:hypothetical protein